MSKANQLAGISWRHPGHLIWICLAYLPFLGSMSVPLTGDQKVYLSTALEMREKGNWLQPVLFGEPSYFKPPFQYWMTLVGWKLFGLNLWGALLPSVLCVLLTAWLMGELARLHQERKWFVNAGLWFAATLGAVTYGTTAQMEIYVCLFYAASWWAGLKYLSHPWREREIKWLYLAFAIAGLASLVKSPLYSVFWVTGFGAYLLISGEWRILRNKHFYAALALGILLGLSWYLAILFIDHERFVHQYFMQETWDKKGGNSGSAGSLWIAVLYLGFPVTLMLIPAIRSIWGKRRTGAMLRFVLCWTLPPAVFFTLYPYRVKTYLFILVPVIALLVDWAYFRVGRVRFFRVMMISTGAALLIVGAALGVLLIQAELAPAWVAIGFALTGALALFCGFKDWMRGLALCSLATVFFFRAAATSLGEHDIAGLRDAVQAHPQSSIAMLDQSRNIWHEYGLLTLALGKRVTRLESPDEVTRFLHEGGMVALTDEQASTILSVIEAKLPDQGERRKLKVSPWKRWKARTKFPYAQLIREGRAGIADFETRFEREYEILSLEAGADATTSE